MLSCKTDFGERYTIGNLEIYYTEDISKKYVEEVGEYFNENNLILEKKHTVQLTSDHDSFILRMIIDPTITSLPAEQKLTVKYLESDIKTKVFEGLNFKIEICDGNFNPIASAN